MTDHVGGSGTEGLDRGHVLAGAARSDDARGPVDCREALTRLFEFLDAEIDEVDGDRIRQHLADCEPCLGEYDFEDHLKKVVKRSCLESAPVELHARIREQLTILSTTVVFQPRSAPMTGDLG